MSAVAPAAPRLVLADRVLGRSLPLDIVLVAAGAALTALLAQIAVPLYPVPITGQTLAVLLVGATLGAARGALSLALYAVLGIVGLPVFSDYGSGVHVILGPTGGYIIGFIVSAGLVGWLSERAWERQILKALATFAAGTLVVFAVGLPWLAVALGLDLMQTLNGGLFPFLIGGAIKALIAAGLLPLAWWGADRLEKRRSSDADPA
jgi:biotin transport system substrate-specific component